MRLEVRLLQNGVSFKPSCSCCPPFSRLAFSQYFLPLTLTSRLTASIVCTTTFIPCVIHVELLVAKHRACYQPDCYKLIHTLPLPQRNFQNIVERKHVCAINIFQLPTFPPINSSSNRRQT